MNNDIKVFIDAEKYRNMILELIESDEINKKYINNTVFRDDDTAKHAVTHGLVLGCMLMSKCSIYCERQKEKESDLDLSIDGKNRTKIRRKLAMELINNIHDDIGYELGSCCDDTDGKFVPSYTCIEYIMDTLRKYEIELEFQRRR